MASIIIDVAAEVIETNGKIDLDFEDGPKFSVLAPALLVEVIEENGSAGGWPEVRIIGEKEDIKKFLKDFYCVDEEDYEFFSEMIVK